MKYLKLFIAPVVASLLLLPKPLPADALPSDSCLSDDTLSTFARQRVDTAATNIQDSLELPQFAEEADVVKAKIDKTSLRTGGKLRDFYVGGASTQDKEGMVEEYLRAQFGPLDDILANATKQQADDLLQQLESDLNQAAPTNPNTEASGSSSRSLDSVTTKRTRYGSFKLQQRNTIGLMEDVGRFSYTVTARATVSVDSISFSERYTTCRENSQGHYSYGARVSITPLLEVSYEFDHLGGSRTDRYQTFSGSFTIIDSDHRVVRELAQDNLL